MKRRAVVSVALVLAACGGGSGEDVSPPPVTVPLRATILKMDSFVGVVTLQAEPAPATILSLTVRSVDLGGGSFRGMPARRIDVTSTSSGTRPNGAGLGVRSITLSGYYGVADGRFVGSLTSGGVPSVATSTPALPDVADVGASGPYGTSANYDPFVEARVESNTSATWSLSASATPGRAWLCIKQLTTAVVSDVPGPQREVCAETNSAGELLRWRGVQAIPGFGVVTFQ